MTTIFILVSGLLVIGFIIWIIKEVRDSDRDFETLKRFRHAEWQGKWAMREYKWRHEVRETAEELEKEFGLEKAEEYYEQMMSMIDTTSPLDPEYKAILERHEKSKRKNDDYAHLSDLTQGKTPEEIREMNPIWVVKGGKIGDAP